MKKVLRRKTFVVMFSAFALAACGVPEEDTRAPLEERPVSAQAYPDCNPATDCIVDSPHVTCGDGVIMDAWSTPDGWCINRDVCGRRGGYIVC
ncbi:hypothetical protein KRR26_31200 [Corallococcus sp. M34]|uniref:hypothetical protein n=1 Tax=Citreicoccus inhibens TaxID=2849499 RepID=UPI001C2438E2|nr:hypothetical protein [Citreicoccus inhibens]MBU8900081.1 hypothetical protein [Citreicoccus inhibens]